MFALWIKNDILAVCLKINRILLMPVLKKVSRCLFHALPPQLRQCCWSRWKTFLGDCTKSTSTSKICRATVESRRFQWESASAGTGSAYPWPTRHHWGHWLGWLFCCLWPSSCCSVSFTQRCSRQLHCVLQNKPRVSCSCPMKTRLVASADKQFWLCLTLEHTLFSGVLLAFFCRTTKEKWELEDTGDSGGILLKSNTEAPGEEVVKTAPKAVPVQVPHFYLYLISPDVFPGFQPHHRSPLCSRTWK